MNLHEYQAAEILQRYGIPVNAGASWRPTPAEARAAAEALGRVAIKAQVHTGGRGKAGGIKLAATPAEAREAAGRDPRPRHPRPHGPQGAASSRRSTIAQEFYLGVMLDRAAARRDAHGQRRGRRRHRRGRARAAGTDRARATPIRLLGLHPYQAREIAFALGLAGRQGRRLRRDRPTALYDAYRRRRRDAGRDQPARPDRGRRLAGARRQDDASTTTRSSATPRSKRCATSSRGGPDRARGHGSPASRSSSSTATSAASSTAPGWRWRRWTPSSCHGGEPANFLDVGGGASAEQVRQGVRASSPPTRTCGRS